MKTTWNTTDIDSYEVHENYRWIRKTTRETSTYTVWMISLFEEERGLYKPACDSRKVQVQGFSIYQF